MKKNVGGTWRRINGLGIVRLPRVVLLAMALAVSAGIPLAIPGPASAQQPITDLAALEVAADSVNLPATATSIQATTIQNGFRLWYSFIGNSSQATVTDPTVSITSGWDHSLFDSVTSFPVTGTTSSLGPGQSWPGPSLNPASEQNPGALSAKYTLGYDSTRTVNRPVIPPRGAKQTVTITLTPQDARYGPAPNPDVSFNIIIYSPLPGVTVASTTNPDNLQIVASSAGTFQWRLGAPILGKTYTVTATLNVPNPFGRPFVYRPVVQIGGERQTTVCASCAGSTVTVNDPTLDGNVLGSGAMTFSVAETSHTWQSRHSDTFAVVYDGTAQVLTPR
jgi:hypothetical protein